jgi:sortase A
VIGCDSVPRRSGPFPWRSLVLALGMLGIVQFGTLAWERAKTSLTRALVAQAWSRTLMAGSPAAPWPGARAWPVARLRVPALHVERYILAGVRGEGLELGPGHLGGTPMPGSEGNSVIRGQGTAQLDFLRQLRLGDVIEIQRADGRWIAYRVVEGAVLDARDVWVAKQEGPNRLTLVTGYPFDAGRSAGRRRYVVFAFELQNRGGERGLRG